MLHIILFVLKILGCVLLAVFSLLLILLLVFLFNPVKYQFSGSYLEKPDVMMRISWLFGIIKAQAEYKNENVCIQVKLAWKSLYNLNKNFKKPDVPDENLHDKSIAPEDYENFSEKKMNSSERQVDEEKKSAVSVETNIKKTEDDSRKKESNQDVLSNRESKGIDKQTKNGSKNKKNKGLETNTKKQNIFEKIMLKMDQFIDKLDLTAEKVEEKMEQLSCRLDKVDRFLSAECTRNSLDLGRRMIISIIKHILPKRVSGRVHFGMDKPSSTGRILGYASCFYPLYGDSIQIEPDFEKTIIEGNLSMSGSIRFYIFIFWGLRMILCKDVRKLIKYVKHLKK